jgi:precorrin-2 dehydrogenase/sirohydrochlorin ferrochelatase
MTEGELYPVMLRLKGRSCVVVGAGGVAQRKVIRLLAVHARVTVISPVLQDPLLRQLADGKLIDARITAYTPGILSDLYPLLVFAATNDPEINRQVATEARSLGALVDVTDASADSDL